jgi:hypothetical protein
MAQGAGRARGPGGARDKDMRLLGEEGKEVDRKGKGRAK